MIQTRNVSKCFFKRINKKRTISFYADNNISFDAHEGEVVGIIGPNGAGKTTLLRMIAGIMMPTSGTILIDNMEHKDKSTEIKKNIAFLTGNTKLYKDISPYELFFMWGKYYNLSDDIIKKRIEFVTKKFNMDSFIHQRIETLSTGQYQRVNISRCLIQDPKYYIFDEPTSGLDIISSKVILDAIKEEKENKKCILYSTHYMEEAENICDRIIMINKGKVIIEGTPDEIRKKTNTSNLRDSFFTLIGAQNE